jgi:osmotically-inducible protein OsmY
MKSNQLYVSILAASSLAFCGTVQAQSSSDTHSATLSSISRVTKDSVENRITAKDLIGAGVYDRTGEKIGDIADIDLQASLPQELSTSQNARENDRSAGAWVKDKMDSSTIFISVGGLWGIGDDLVSVPTSQLRYNAVEERYELSASKADVVALAEQDANEFSADRRMSETAVGKQSFADEATRVKKALQSDPMTSAFAQNITVTSDGESLQIHGTVANKDQQKKLLDAARRATSVDIDDKLKVR